MASPINHNERSHALLSASGASRWLNCTPSAKLEEAHGESKSSPYAAEGTLAHEYAEILIREMVLKNISPKEKESKLSEIIDNDLFNEEMLDAVPVYVNYCYEQFIAAKTHNQYAVMEIEQRLDLTEFVPESFGTADCTIIDDTVLEVIDLKYGKGVPVYAEWNRQLMLYGLGALRKYDTMYDIERVKLTIVQPRINNISSFIIEVDELLDWANTELKQKALMAFEGKGELNAGDWCKFCAVKNRCRKLYEQQFEVAKLEFTDPELLSDEEIADIVARAPKFVEYVNSIADYARAKALDGKKWPGFKLVEGKSSRKWAGDEDEIASTIFTRCPELSEDEIYETTLKSLTSIEKLLGKKKFADVLGDMVVKPQGKPTLVPEDDKRPAIGNEQAKLDFD